MDLFTLDPVTWMPTGAPIRYYESLIWTEKFFEPGEIELETYAIADTLSTIKIGSLLSIRESKEVMMVETISIQTDDKDVEKLKVVGKSVTSYLAHRAVGALRGVKYEMSRSYSNLDAGLVVLFNSFVNGEAYDYTTLQDAYYKNPKDRVPLCMLSDSTFSLTPSDASPRFITPGSIESVIRQWFAEYPIGIRMLRPPNTVPAKVTINKSGVISRTSVVDAKELVFDIFVGIDRSSDQTEVSPVVLDVEHDDLINPQYLISATKFKSEVHILLDHKSILTSLPDSVVSGLDRRVVVVDGGAPDDGENVANFEADAVMSAKEMLYDASIISGVDANVSSNSSEKIGVHYFLGDFVTVRGRYGIISRARVVELIRSESGEGEIVYPTLLFE